MARRLAGDGEAQANGGGADIAALVERLEALGPDQDQLRQYLTGNAGEEAFDGDGEPEPFDLDGEPGLEDAEILYTETGHYGEAQDDDGSHDELVAQHLDALINQGINEAVAPIAQQQAELRREVDAERLAQQFPALSDSETAEFVVRSASDFVTANNWPAELANDPRMWGLVYAAHCARMADAEEAAAAEAAAGAPAHLEGGAGAGPAGGPRTSPPT